MSTARTIRFILNGAPVKADIEPRETLIDVLQQRFNLGGARESCGQGLCGCCTAIVDGKAISSCLFLAWFADGAVVDTIEHLGSSQHLDPIQEAFIEAGAFQCGFCTPGFILMTKQFLDIYPNPSDEDIRHYLAGNLCRCSAYPEILDAVKLAVQRRNSTAAPA
jgi:carbon-monoxide dehydrogenase small subunit